jgi:hypothetical protein
MEAFLVASHEAIEIHSRWGVGIGHAVVAEWFDTTPMRISVKSLGERGAHVLVHHHIDWIGENGRIDSSIDNAAMIETREGKVFSYRRLEDAEAVASEFRPVSGCNC